MLKVFTGSKFRLVSPTEKGLVTFYRSKTDKRFVLDIAAPGYAADDVTVMVSPDNSKIKVTLDPTGRPPFDYDGDPDRFGYNEVKMRLGSITEEFDIDPEIYDLETINVEANAGVIRIWAAKIQAPWSAIPVSSAC